MCALRRRRSDVDHHPAMRRDMSGNGLRSVMPAWSLERTMRLLAVMEKSSRFLKAIGGFAELDQLTLTPTLLFLTLLGD